MNTHKNRGCSLRFRTPPLILLVALGINLSSTPGEARPPIRSDFFARYPGAVGTHLDDLPGNTKHCGVCHVDFDGGGRRNPYGVAVEALIQLGYSSGNAMAAVENNDSDGDGVTTLVELTNTLFNNTPTFPGLSSANVGGVLNISLAVVSPYLTPSGSSDISPPAVTLTAPNGGNVLAAGTFFDAIYTATDANGIAGINVFLSTDGGATFKMLHRGVAPGTSVPVFIPDLPTSQGILKLEALDNAGNRGSDVSDAVFTITPLPGLAPTTLEDMELPGTQPFQGAVLDDPSTHCASCHGNYDPANEPWETWRGSMMGQAMRDPLFLACVTVAEQDAPGVGDLCIRCHSPGGWQEGRSLDTSGAMINAKDRQGVQCDFCHRVVDQNYVAGTSPPRDSLVLAGVDPLPLQYGNGQFINDPSPQMRGPFDADEANHQYVESPIHRSANQCGLCHDVSNPVFMKTGPRDYTPTPFNEKHPTMNLRDMMPIERTFSEWSVSTYATTGVFAPQFAGNKADGIVSTCQDCHMRDANAKGCNQGGIAARPDMPIHDLMGGNTFIPDVLASLYPTEVNVTALQSAKQRAIRMLQLAATMTLTPENFGVTVRVTNETGHKLPSGYPEGRRIWLNVTARDNTNNVVFQSGAYDAATGVLTHDPQIKVYEIHPGLSPELAGALGLTAGKSFHFVLNDTVYSDNRIPPRGFTNAAFEAIQSPAVDHAYADGQYWDDTSYNLPLTATSVTVTLYYQPTTKEYIEFLKDENRTNSTGQTLYNAWVASGKAPPVVMQQATAAVNVTVSAAPVGGAPRRFTLAPARPNPASGRTQLAFSLLERGPVRIDVFDVRGRLVRTLVNEPMDAGDYQAIWDGDTDRGIRAAGGVYYVRLKAGSRTAQQSVIRVN